jgi:hypothetical protein
MKKLLTVAVLLSILVPAHAASAEEAPKGVPEYCAKITGQAVPVRDRATVRAMPMFYFSPGECGIFIRNNPKISGKFVRVQTWGEEEAIIDAWIPRGLVVKAGTQPVPEVTAPETTAPPTTGLRATTPTTSGNAQRLQDEKAAAKAEACALEKEAKFNLDQAAERTRLAGDEMSRLSQELARLTPSSARYQSVRSAHARAMADFDRYNASKKSWLELTWQAQDVCRSYN